MAGLTPTGFDAKSLDDARSEMEDSVHAGVGPGLELDDETLNGQELGAVASQLRQLWELGQVVAASQSIDQAEGQALTDLVATIGVYREAASYSTKPLNLTLAANTYLAGTLVVYVAGDATRRFKNKFDVTSPGGVVVGVVMEAETLGPVIALAGTLTTIANPVVGFTSVAADLVDAVLGSDEETDPALRARAVDELARKGSTSVEAIKADLLEVSGVTFASVLENDTDVTNADGLPPHSFEAIVLGGTDADVRQQVFLSKAAGIRAYGSNTGTITDSMGNSRTIAFSRPTDVNVQLVVGFNWLTGTYSDNTAAVAAVTTLIQAKFTELQGVGRDIILTRYVGALMALNATKETILDVLVQAGPSPGVAITSNLTIGPRERAVLLSLTVTGVQLAANP